MKVNGVDVSKLGAHTQKEEYFPPVVPGRVAHIDGDFLAYMVAYDDTKSVEEMKHNCEVLANYKRKQAAAEHMVIHLTPKESNKGMRPDKIDPKTGKIIETGLALLREYQTNRKGKPKPKYLHLIRAHMADAMDGIQHVNCEADDGMSMAQYEAIKAGKRNLSIIVTKDKDLAMVPGLTLDWDTGDILDTEDDFGYIRLDDTKSAKKIKGRGWKLFWCQMLTGDAADNISGLPKCYTLDYLPNGKPKACGPVLAYEIMSPVKTNKEAFEIVRTLYRDFEKLEGFKNYRDNSPITAGQALISEGQLLWMRRKLDKDDFIHWLQETCL